MAPLPSPAPMTVYDALEELVILQFGTKTELDDQRQRFGLSDAEFWAQIESDARSFLVNRRSPDPLRGEMATFVALVSRLHKEGEPSGDGDDFFPETSDWQETLEGLIDAARALTKSTYRGGKDE